MPELVPHGTLDYEEIAQWGYRPKDMIIFSSNINPYGPPPSVIQLVADNVDSTTLALYPDRFSMDLRSKLAEHHDVPAEGILVGNGTADIMWLLAVQFMRGKRVSILSPTFGEYANAAEVVGVKAELVARPGWRKQTDGTFAPGATSINDVVDKLHGLSPEIIFVCNPNSPTGEHLLPEEMKQLLASAPDALWILDEAYAAFTPNPWCAAEWSLTHNVIVLRSMTKDFSLGGLRLGYAIAHPDRIRAMSATQPPWNVNALAQIAGLGCMDEIDWRTASLAQLRDDTNALQQRLTNLGYSPRETTANYFLVPTKNPAALRESLLRHRIVVRDCTSFGLPTFIRLATQRPEHNQLLLQALSELKTSELY